MVTPVADHLLDQADPDELVRGERRWPLVYVGNQYGRDSAFDAYFAPAARVHDHRVAGKWTQTAPWPHVNFTGRIGFREGQELQRRSLTAVLLLPERYAAVGHMTQRLPEAVLAGCLPIGPADIRDIDRFVPAALRAANGAHVTDIISGLASATGEDHARLLGECLTRLNLFRASTHTTVINRQLDPKSGVDLGLLALRDDARL